MLQMLQHATTLAGTIRSSVNRPESQDAAKFKICAMLQDVANVANR